VLRQSTRLLSISREPRLPPGARPRVARAVESARSLGGNGRDSAGTDATYSKGALTARLGGDPLLHCMRDCEPIWSALTDGCVDHTDERDHGLDVAHGDTAKPPLQVAMPARSDTAHAACVAVRISHQVGRTGPLDGETVRWGSRLHTRGLHLPPSGQQLLGTHTHRTRARRRRLVSPSARAEGDLELLLGCSQPRRRLLDHCPLPPE
jgi:hypothetical protein